MESAIVGALVQAGTAGGVVVWFMFRNEGRMDALTRAVNRLTLAHALDVATRPTADEATRALARDLIEEIKADRHAPAPVPAVA